MKFVKVSVDAIQLTKDNHKEVLHFIIEHSCSDKIEYGISIDQINGFVIRNGDWIVFEDDRIYKASDKQFRRNFKLVTEET